MMNGVGLEGRGRERVGVKLEGRVSVESEGSEMGGKDFEAVEGW